uniref:Gametocyte-specific factor 1 n=1 Tax=Caligus clemensi TaxID=344056 RepID=C1C0H8_CALCM|nr:Gametocyte-specific factor 1 [Caligus clemensi]
MSSKNKRTKNPIEKGDTWLDSATNLVQCPYDPYHRLLPERFALHLVRCRKNLLADTTSPFHKVALSVLICRFDNTHHIPGGEEKMAEHLANDCEAADAIRKPVVKAVVIPEWKKTKAREAMPNPQDVQLEDWNTSQPEIMGQDVYNPVEKLRSTPNVILNPQGLTKSQRRAFRENQRVQGEDFDKMWTPPIAEEKW